MAAQGINLLIDPYSSDIGGMGDFQEHYTR